MNSLRDELAFLFSGRGMPYQKVSIMVSLVIVVVFSIFFSNNKIQHAEVAVIDLDNSKYSHEFIEKMNNSPYIKVTAVINVPVEPKTLFYQDRCVAVVYLPKDLEKNRYTQSSGSIGIFYDNTNTAQTGQLKETLNAMVAMESQGGSEGLVESGIVLNDRNLFNPVESSSNSQPLAFLFFFSSMYFVFATIGMIPRLRMEGKLQRTLEQGTPFDILPRLVPYCGCLLTAFFFGMAILRVGSDMIFSGSIIFFLITQIIYVFVLGVISLIFGWTAANPGIASSRMIFFLPGGFILGGMTGPIAILSKWALVVSHVFPLVWEFRFVRDIMMRGAGFMDCAKVFGAFLIYVGSTLIVFCLIFYRAKRNLEEHNKLKAMAVEG